MKRALLAIGYGVGGLLVAVALTLGAYAIAGSDIARPAPVVGSVPVARFSLSPTPAEDREGHHANEAAGQSPSAVDDGGSSSRTSSPGSGGTAESSSPERRDDSSRSGAHGGRGDD